MSGDYDIMPLCAFIGWAYDIMEIVGENTESPFQGLLCDYKIFR